MAIKITPHLITLTYTAALKSFWRKPALKKFLLSCHVSQQFISSWASEETKRDFLDRVFEKLQLSDKGLSLIGQMALALSEQNSFPDLEGWEDTKTMIAAAKKAISELSSYIKQLQIEAEDEKSKAQYIEKLREEREHTCRSTLDKKDLENRINSLSKSIGSTQAGYDFQKWFYDMLNFCEIECRQPYKTNGREIDGSLTLDGTTYLVELKFTAKQSGAQDIDVFKSKIESKADNTMGIMVSMSGYSSTAIKEASGRKTTLLLFDYQHLFHFLTGTMKFDEIILRVRRHAAQTGEAYIRPTDF